MLFLLKDLYQYTKDMGSALRWTPIHFNRCSSNRRRARNKHRASFMCKWQGCDASVPSWSNLSPVWFRADAGRMTGWPVPVPHCPWGLSTALRTQQSVPPRKFWGPGVLSCLDLCIASSVLVLLSLMVTTRLILLSVPLATMSVGRYARRVKAHQASTYFPPSAPLISVALLSWMGFHPLC